MSMHDFVPTGIRIQEPPPHPISEDAFHSTAPVQERSQHAFTEIYYIDVLFGFGWPGCVIGHRMFLGDGRYDESRMEVHQGIAERSKF